MVTAFFAICIREKIDFAILYPHAKTLSVGMLEQSEGMEETPSRRGSFKDAGLPFSFCFTFTWQSSFFLINLNLFRIKGERDSPSSLAAFIEDKSIVYVSLHLCLSLVQPRKIT